jgi:hypothetical protein
MVITISKELDSKIKKKETMNLIDKYVLGTKVGRITIITLLIANAFVSILGIMCLAVLISS